MGKIRNLSIRKTIVLYMVVSLTVCFFLSAAVIRCAETVQENIWWKYVDQEKYIQADEEAGHLYMVKVPRPAAYEMEELDHGISEFCDFLQTYTVLIMSVLGSVGAVFLFYKNKLKAPIEELELASRKISRDDLDFHIMYENKDEMGRLCLEFERMREQLALNNRKLWETIEEEKTLRAAISHDIRSPLTVLRGYQEMLRECLSGEKINREQAAAMVEESDKQLKRMDIFVETMRKLSSLEKREPEARRLTGEELKKEIQGETEILQRQYGKRCSLVCGEMEMGFSGDREMILEVAENLLSNGLRYAREAVEIRLSVTKEEVRICVRDDGTGFGEKIEEVTKPFYQQNVKDSLKHAGLGMYISRLYCEKHGGRLLLKNGEGTGAVITAVFRRIA